MDKAAAEAEAVEVLEEAGAKFRRCRLQLPAEKVEQARLL